jgi:hypothetical protein
MPYTGKPNTELCCAHGLEDCGGPSGYDVGFGLFANSAEDVFIAVVLVLMLPLPLRQAGLNCIHKKINTNQTSNSSNSNVPQQPHESVERELLGRQCSLLHDYVIVSNMPRFSFPDEKRSSLRLSICQICNNRPVRTFSGPKS